MQSCSVYSLQRGAKKIGEFFRMMTGYFFLVQKKKKRSRKVNNKKKRLRRKFVYFSNKGDASKNTSNSCVHISI